VARWSPDSRVAVPPPTSAETPARPAAATLRIESVAERTGLTKRAIRYYEEVGLLPRATRSTGGYRLYTEEDVRRLERIQRLKESAGLSLAEIASLLEAEAVRDRLRERYHSTDDAADRRAMVEQAIEVVRWQRDVVLRKREVLETLQAEYEERLARLERLRRELAREEGRR
jgi:DNA-binding transcriptional MerR regulator